MIHIRFKHGNKCTIRLYEGRVWVRVRVKVQVLNIHLLWLLSNTVLFAVGKKMVLKQDVFVDTDL